MKAIIKICLTIFMVLIVIANCNTGSEKNVVEEHYNNAVELGSQGEFEKAKTELEKALELDSLYIGAESCLILVNDVLTQKIERQTAFFLFRSIECYNKGNLDEIIAEIDKAIKINPEYAFAYIIRGLAYKNNGLYDQAIADYTKAIEINPGVASAYNNRGVAYVEKGLNDLAIADFTKALEINPMDADAYSNRGCAYGKKGLYDNAIADFTMAIEINPGFAGTYYNLGYAFDNAGRKRKAVEAYKKFMQITTSEYDQESKYAHQRIKELEK